jgi:hypothetical protein
MVYGRPSSATLEGADANEPVAGCAVRNHTGPL